MTAKKMTEFNIDCAHRPGQLADVLEALAGSGINILALIGHGEGDKATIMLVPENPDQAEDVLKGLGVTFRKCDVVAVTSASGTGQGSMIARKVGDAGVNMEYAYATTSGAGESTFILAAKDIDAALKALS